MAGRENAARPMAFPLSRPPSSIPKFRRRRRSIEGAPRPAQGEGRESVPSRAAAVRGRPPPGSAPFPSGRMEKIALQPASPDKFRWRAITLPTPEREASSWPRHGSRQSLFPRDGGTRSVPTQPGSPPSRARWRRREGDRYQNRPSNHGPNFRIKPRGVRLSAGNPGPEPRASNTAEKKGKSRLNPACPRAGSSADDESALAKCGGRNKAAAAKATHFAPPIRAWNLRAMSRENRPRGHGVEAAGGSHSGGAPAAVRRHQSPVRT